MRLRRRSVAVLLAVASMLGGGSAAAPAAEAVVQPAAAVQSVAAVQPVDAGAGPQARAVLNWLAQLPDRGLRNRTASGFFAGYSGSAAPGSGKDFATQYRDVTELADRTGRFPAVLACDYASGWNADGAPTAIDSGCNTEMIDHAGRGGLVSVSVHLPNPVAGAAWRTPLPRPAFRQLSDPATAAGRAWRAELDDIAAGLRRLSDAGVPVLFRPFHEMNGYWFWWGGQDPADFAALWRGTYDYLTTTKGLHNLLWTYAPNCGSADPTAYWVGRGYADVVGLDCYTADPSAITGYEKLVELGKPFAFTEIGPGSGAGGTFDYELWVKALHERFPRTSYFLAWNNEWSPARNVNGTKLMNDPWTVNRGGVDLAAAPAENPPVAYQDFESDTQGWSGWHLAAGPWQVTEWSARGSGSLKADVDLGTGAAYLNKVGPLDLSGDTLLSVDARTAPWGDQAGGTRAKLYVRTGTGDAAGWTWTDSGAVTVDSKSTRLVLDLTRVPDRAHVREIGVEFAPAAGASGRSAVYLDDMRRGGLLAGFEHGTEGWSGSGAAAGPWAVADEGAAEGRSALKADVEPERGAVRLRRTAPADLTGATVLTVAAGTAPWGQQAGGTTATLYVRTGTGDASGWTWTGSPAVTVGPDGRTLRLDLAGVPDPAHVQEIGVEFTPAPGATGRTAVYLDGLRRWS
ncbi:glycoside hydrolase family 26 protein [Kitasatospora purpeofusca]|uniref:glycosyl hydrolase n=1 Tax=Kitasatospora purpeofusca TaxID=67352 RepID=UPI002E0E742D|nr:glycosyl hydrolase [Kitasatospora purpeofusca]WSR44988.1 glycoside hydrolase family 26 protein [Kitasatospora purpeofusca]